MNVLVGVIANDAARFSEFWSCVLRLKVPAGSIKDQVIGGDWCSARNELAQRCLGEPLFDEKGRLLLDEAGEPKISEPYDYLWFMDDDHSFAPDLLQKLLSSAVAYDLPILTPLCTTRTAPFHLVSFAANPNPNSTDRYLPISLTGVPGEGIVELEAGGCAGMLIRRDVLEQMPPPWFEYTDTSEDLLFCQKAKKSGFKIYADLSCRLGHITTAVVMPGIVDEDWVTGLTVGRDFQVVIPRAERLLEQQEAEMAEENAEWTEGEEFIPPAGEVEMNDEPEVKSSEAERIEIWLDDEFRWWWRAIDFEGNVLRRDSGINEQGVIGQAHLFYPGVSVHQVQREVDDSRNLRQYRVPGRMWGRDSRL